MQCENDSHNGKFHEGSPIYHDQSDQIDNDFAEEQYEDKYHGDSHPIEKTQLKGEKSLPLKVPFNV